MISISAQSFSCVRLFATPWTVAHQAPLSLGFFKQDYCTGVPLLKRIFLTQELNVHLPCLQHYRRILYPLSHGGNHRFQRKEKVKVTQSCLTFCDPTGLDSLSLLQGIFALRDQTQVSLIAGIVFSR